MLCVHGARHVWDKLEAVGCLAELLRSSRDFDWEYAWHRAGEMRSRRMLVLGLLLVRGLFDIPLPGVAEASSRSRSLRTMAHVIARRFSDDRAEPQGFAASAAIHLRLKDRYRDRARYCAGVALTSTPEDWAAVRLPNRLAFAYSVVRAARVARKHFHHQQSVGAQQ